MQKVTRGQAIGRLVSGGVNLGDGVEHRATQGGYPYFRYVRDYIRSGVA